jgi:peptide/nickel transport system substrate-binding protein
MAASGDIPALWPELICYTSTPYGWMPFIQNKNPNFDELVFKAWAQEATDPEAAHTTWVEAQRILHDDAASVFMLDFPYVAVYQDSLVGFQPNEAYVYIVFFYQLSRQ